VYALTSDNMVYSWGRSYLGRTGEGHTPAPVEALTGKILKDFINPQHSLGTYLFALTNDGKVYSWGRSDNGSLGHGAETDVSTPTVINGFDGKVISRIYVGDNGNIYAVANDNTVYAWGVNEKGILGVGDTENKNIPTLVTFP
ncbi:MAG: hypothetical protein IJD28_06455, partial [Deferribacterales bacterium]|nr:hypothetical protein [Deferribacterales bacterium]